ncbi:MAG: hypothetical protein EXR58_07775 [Chloroflexi bacterium]|nr:hypothetical protein [Chloroflexota bacterium]
MRHSAARAIGFLFLAFAISGCGPRSDEASEIHCSSVPDIPTGEAPADPEFTLYGFPRIAATGHFTPGQETTVSADAVRVTLPADLHTEPLDFELLLGNVSDWQPCMGSERIVISPYAFRATNSTTRKLIGRFDNPAISRITDPRIKSSALYWITSAENPPSVEPSSPQPPVEGTTVRVENQFTRRGWFVTVKRG